MLELHPNQIPDDLKQYFKPKYDGKPLIRRNTIIWYKRNCMPSSVKDRFTVDFEPVYFFVKQGEYWFKQQKENGAGNKWGKYTNLKYGNSTDGAMQSIKEMTREEYIEKYESRNMRCVWYIPTEPSTEPHFAMFPQKLIEPMLAAGCPPDGIVLDPFGGMCTVASVAIKQGKRFIMMELSPEYASRSQKRISLEKQQLNMFHKTEPEKEKSHSDP